MVKTTKHGWKGTALKPCKSKYLQKLQQHPQTNGCEGFPHLWSRCASSAPITQTLTCHLPYNPAISRQLNVSGGLSDVFISKYSRKHVELTTFLHHLTQANAGKISAFASLWILLEEGKHHNQINK